MNGPLEQKFLERINAIYRLTPREKWVYGISMCIGSFIAVACFCQACGPYVPKKHTQYLDVAEMLSECGPVRFVHSSTVEGHGWTATFQDGSGTYVTLAGSAAGGFTFTRPGEIIE